MRILILILTLAAAFAGCLILTRATTALHEIEAFILFLISSVLLGSSAIVDAVNKLGTTDIGKSSLARNTDTPSFDRLKSDLEIMRANRNG